jgi:2'-phosphotransferase
MSRTHIHLASGLPGTPGVISGVRLSCDTFIYIDVDKAMQGGIQFFRSPNGVILTKGDENGRLGKEWWQKVEGKQGETVKF